MKTTIMTLGILLASQAAFAGSCESYFKKLNVPVKKIQRVLNCELLTESNDSRNVIYLNHDQLCVTEFTDVDGSTASFLNFATRGRNNLSVRVPHKKVTLDRDILKITDLNYVTNGGFIPLYFTKSEIIINNNSSNKPSMNVNITQGKRIGGNVEVVFAGTYSCRKGNSLLDLFDL